MKMLPIAQKKSGRPGRPPKQTVFGQSKEQLHTKRLNLTLPAPTIEQIKVLAAKSDISWSEVVDKAVWDASSNNGSWREAKPRRRKRKPQSQAAA